MYGSLSWRCCVSTRAILLFYAMLFSGARKDSHNTETATPFSSGKGVVKAIALPFLSIAGRKDIRKRFMDRDQHLPAPPVGLRIAPSEAAMEVCDKVRRNPARAVTPSRHTIRNNYKALDVVMCKKHPCKNDRYKLVRPCHPPRSHAEISG